MYHDQVRHTTEIQSWLNIQKSSNDIYHINRIKQKHMLISVNSKIIGQNPTIFHDISMQWTKLQKTPQPGEKHLQETHNCHNSSVVKDWMLHPQDEEQDGVPTFTTCSKHRTTGHTLDNQTQSKRNKRHPDFKGTHKITCICRWYAFIYKTF